MLHGILACPPKGRRPIDLATVIGFVRRLLTFDSHSGTIPSTSDLTIMSRLRRYMLSGLIAGLTVPLAFSACRTAPVAPVERKKEASVDLSDKVQSLERQVRERDKRIEELESQLEALKLIDQEHEKQRKPIRPPATLESAP